MRFPAGTRLGPYEIDGIIGAGAMGEVYRARDTRLTRSVALKILPAVFAADTDRLARFKREAQILASLNHTNIAAIHGLEESDGVDALVLELVDGPTLADRLDKGAIPLDEALPIAKQLAEALEAAHEQGIVHRDLKPANIKLRDDGMVKVLDFGLAKAVERLPSAATNVTASPTFTSPLMTEAGIVLGTAAYMAPEQAHGRATDKRCDIWAFGAVLYEMLSGQRAFAGDSFAEVVSGVLTREVEWSKLPSTTPPSVVELLRRCLERDPKKRLRDIGEARLILDAPEATRTTRIDPGPQRGKSLVPIGAGCLLAGLFLGFALAATRWSAPERPAGMMQFTVSLAPAERLAGGAEAQRPLDRAVAISRDGRVLVFAGERKTGTSLERMLFRREIDQPVATPIAGTEGADFPILSPDRASVAFVARDGKLRRVGIDGGTPVDISALDLAAFGGGVVGASWGDDGTIVLGSFIGPLRRVAVSGGATTAITSVESDGSNYSHRLPYQLPDGQGLLYTALADPIGDAGRIYVLPPGGGTPRLVLENAADPRLASGHLLFARTGVVMAVRFDPGALQVAGGPAVVVQDVMQSLGTMQPGANSLAAQFDVSGAGSLVFASGGVYPPANTRLHWFYPGGKSEPIGEGGRELLSPRLSRDGKGIAVAQFGDAKQPLRLYDVDRGLWTSWGDLAGQVAFPVWTPDGQVAFNWFTNGSSGIHMGRPDGTALRQITAGPRPRIPSDVSSDGKWLAFLESFTPTVLDTWVMPVDGSAPPRLLIRASAQTTFSPDGHWIAYSSGMSGVEEIYVEAFPGLGMRRQVSSGGGTNPVWAPDGRTLYYINGPVGGASMMSVPITPGSPLGVGTPRELGPFPFLTSGPSRCYDITPDGRRFVVESYEPPKPAPATGLHVILNWPERLRN